MLLKRNLLETVTLISSGGTLFCVLLNYVTNISPLSGVWLLVYLLFLFFVGVLFSFKFIQWLLHLNKPVKYDLDLKEYPWLGWLGLRVLRPRVTERPECKEYDTNELSVISTVLERRLVSSWYVAYISEEIGFPFACKQLLDQMISKMFEICNKIETRDVFVDICSVVIVHLKEYKKALKRHEKSPTSSVESLYKKTHPIFNSTDKKHSSADHCVNILRIILKELVPWELWDTPHSELLIRVLAKKLDNFVDNTLADPEWLNDKLFEILEGKPADAKPKTENESESVNESNVEPQSTKDAKTEKETPKPNTEPVNATMKTVTHKINEEPKEGSLKVNSVVEEIPISTSTGVSTEPVEIKPTAVMRQRRGRQGRNEVKIYDRIIEGSVKTWETDMDLQCISVGQDLLASLDEMTLSRLWGQEDAEHSPNLRNKSPQPLWFGEEDAIDLEPEPDPKEPKKENSAKPTDALLKDLQTTVNQAKTKIGDLQVPLEIDVPCKNSSDEAAGMMEGLLDIGIAGFKKGLRFTGLSDDSQEKSPAHHKDKSSDKTPPETRSSQSRATEHKEAVSAAQRDDNGSAVPHLVKQHRVTSQDSVPLQPVPRAEPPLPPLSDSPELEYEEVADLSTSIAKLRSLLQETSNASRGEEIWWEGAEETRGRTHHAAAYSSSRPVDTATLADEYDMTGEPNSSPRQASNNMQRLDKLLQRTVTGVFNSLRTAVGGEGGAGGAGGAEGGAGGAPPRWSYLPAEGEGAGGALARLLGARRELCHVDAALDSLRRAPAPRPPPPPPEDFEEWCASAGAAWSGAGEAGCAAGLCRSHVAFRAITLLAADVGESLITWWLEELSAWVRAQVFEVFRRGARGTAPAAARGLRPLRVDDTCALLVSKIPGLFIFGEETVTSAARLVVSSFSHKEVNKEVIYKVLDLFAAHFKRSAGLRNPSFDNN